ncbi:hypothetical protein KUCAC02_029490, partial [Chaenocephalus aceratus]
TLMVQPPVCWGVRGFWVMDWFTRSSVAPLKDMFYNTSPSRAILLISHTPSDQLSRV